LPRPNGSEFPEQTKGDGKREILWRWNLRNVRFATLAIRVVLSLILLFCIYKVVRRGIGDWYFRKESPASIQAAIKWDSDNPQYYDALGTLTHFYGDTKDLDASVAFYENATRLSPYDAHFWSDLGAAYDWAGRTNDAMGAFERAIHLFPASPEINWRFANFAFRTHRIPEGLRALQIVLAGGVPTHRDVFLLATRATRDNGAILEDMLPRQASTFFDYLNFQIETGNMVAAEQVWLRLLQLNLPFALPQAFPYLDALIQHREVSRLAAAWSTLTERFPAQIKLRTNALNLITNGGFEFDILNGGLDWRIIPVEGAVVSVDSHDSAEGTRALRIEFNAKSNLGYEHTFQYVVVQPNTRYKFSGSLRANGITTDSGPRFQIFDAFDISKLFLSTENVVGAIGWSPQRLEFKTGADTHLLIVRIARPASTKIDNQIRGTAWIAQVSLNAEK
jgi:tetratricopeptide (TPR) repeat protein